MVQPPVINFETDTLAPAASHGQDVPILATTVRRPGGAINSHGCYGDGPHRRAGHSDTTLRFALEAVMVPTPVAPAPACLSRWPRPTASLLS
jgi:hypothetical protein